METDNLQLSRYVSCVNCVLDDLHCSHADDDARMCVASRGSSNISAPRPAKVGFTNVREGVTIALTLATGPMF